MGRKRGGKKIGRKREGKPSGHYQIIFRAFLFTSVTIKARCHTIPKREKSERETEMKAQREREKQWGGGREGDHG